MDVRLVEYSPDDARLALLFEVIARQGTDKPGNAIYLFDEMKAASPEAASDLVPRPVLQLAVKPRYPAAALPKLQIVPID